jgi:ADP-heptose:LPS heptosyltransferase
MTRVLIVRLSAMGDLVQSLGAVRALHEAQPGLELHFVTQRENAPLLEQLPFVASVVQHDRRGGIRALLGTTRSAMRRLRCEVALDLQGNWKSAACAWLSGAPVRIGAAGPWRQEPWSQALLTKRVVVDGPRHPGLVAHAIVRELAPSARALPPRLVATEQEVEIAAQTVREAGVDPGKPFLALLLGRPGDPRSLRAQAVGEAMAGRLPVLAVLGPQSDDVQVPPGAFVLQQSRGQLRRLVGLGEVVRRCGGEVWGADQGPAHVLAAVGANTTVMFGPQDPRRTAPPSGRVLQHPAPPACMPCSRMRCSHAEGPVCMNFGPSQGREASAVPWLAAEQSAE